MPVLAGAIQLGLEMPNQRATLRSLAVLVVVLFTVIAMIVMPKPARAPQY